MLRIGVIISVGVTTVAGVSSVTLFCTSRFGDYGTVAVVVHLNDFLCNKNGVTYRTVLTFGKTCFSAGWSYSLIDNFGMTVSLNDFLCQKNRVTYGAMLSFCKSCFGTGGSDCFVDHFGMAVRLDNFLLYEDLSALGALTTVGKARFRTSRRFTCDNGCISMSTLGIANKSANVTNFVILIIVCVCNHRNFCLCYKNCVTYRAVLTLGETGFNASRLYGFVYSFGMSLRFDCLCFYFAASALAFLFAFLGAVGFFRSFPLAKSMTCSIHICIDITIAAVAGVSSVALFGTSRIGNYNFIRVSGCVCKRI